MKKKARLLLIPLVTLVVAADNSQDSASRKDPNALQGTWNLVSAMEDGNALPEDKVKKTPIVFKDDGFHFPGSAEYATSRAEKIKVDATKSPKQMHAISTKKEVMLGIYELNGDSTRPASPRSASRVPAISLPRLVPARSSQIWQRQKKKQ